LKIVFIINLERKNILILFRYLLVQNFLIGIITLISFFIKTPFTIENEFSLILGHENLLSAFFMLHLPISLFVLIKDNIFWKLIAFFSLLTSFIIIYFIFTRSVFLSLIISLFFVLITCFIKRFKSVKNFFFSNNISYAIKSIGFFLLVISSVFIFHNNVEKKYIKTDINTIDKSGSFYERFELWHNSIDLIKNESFISGVGIGSWKLVFPKYSKNTWRVMKGDVQFQRPHNDFILMFCELGIVGFLFYSLLFSFIIKNILIKIYSSRDNILYYLILFGVFSYIIFALNSFPRERFFHNVILVLFFAISTSNKNIFLNKNLKNYRKWLILLIMFFSIFYSFTRFKGEIYAKNAFYSMKNNNWIQVIENVNKINLNFYNINPVSAPIHWMNGVAHLNLNNWDEAIQSFILAEKNHPNNSKLLNDIASFYYLKEDYYQAIFYYEKSLNLAPLDNQTILNLTSCYHNIGNLKEAFVSLKNYIEIDNNYIYYYNSIIRSVADYINLKIKIPIFREKVNSLIKEESFFQRFRAYNDISKKDIIESFVFFVTHDLRNDEIINSIEEKNLTKKVLYELEN